MKTWLPLFAACLLTAGCRTDPRLATVFESMNAEKRYLEDRVYELEDENDLQADQIESARRENSKLRKQLGGEGSSDSPAKKQPRGDAHASGSKFDGTHCPRALHVASSAHEMPTHADQRVIGNTSVR